jgi:two-component system chemotaxis sensor kinase CheA
MDDLLREFLTETGESLDVVDVELVRFEQEPNNAAILGNIFRLVHTIKGTCGFLGLPRLGALTHAAETLMGKFRDGAAVTPEAVGLVLRSIDRIKTILTGLETDGEEPAGSDGDLIARLEDLAERRPAPPPIAENPAVAEPARRLRPGEVSLEELEKAFRETAVDPLPEPRPRVDFAHVAAELGARMARTGPPPKEIRPPEPSSDAADGRGPVASQSIRVTVETLEKLMTLVSELVLTRNQLLEIVRQHESSEFKAPLQRLSNITAELQEGVMKTRMQPIGNAWQKLPRVVRDLAHELGKEIELEMIGAETELDRQVLELIKDPLTHMVRNSADHGLEGPEERRSAGKPARGTVTLSARHESGHVVIEIADDGRGLDVARIRAKALENGLAGEAELEAMSEAQVARFIFSPGFSTAAEVTSISGRGIGMDVALNNIEAIGGTIELAHQPGRGTRFTIRIPLTLAIVATLIVESDGERYAIPQLSVVELLHVQAGSAHRVERIKDAAVLRLRDKLLPLASLAQLLGGEAGAGADAGFVVVMHAGKQTFGILVDKVLNTEEIVVKPMSRPLRQIPMFSGNTILGDGSVIMILDPDGLQRAVGSGTEAAAATALPTSADADDGNRPVAMLLFRAGSAEPKAVPLSLVTRLEEIDVAAIERSGGRELVQYRGALMPLVRFPGAAPRSEGAQPILVFSDAGRSMGLVVDEIVDIVEERLSIELSSELPGMLGMAVVRGQATEVIDVGHFLPLAFADWFHRQDAAVKRAPPRLLLVDDSAFFRNMLAPVLRTAGFGVTVAESAAEAMAILGAGAGFDAVVSDIEMPGMDGFQFAEALRADKRFRALPIIAVSALCTPADIKRGRNAGFDDYVAKFDRPSLIAAVREFTGAGVGLAA